MSSYDVLKLLVKNKKWKQIWQAAVTVILASLLLSLMLPGTSCPGAGNR